MTNIESIPCESSQKLERLSQYLSYTPDNINLSLDAIPLAIELQNWQQAKELVTSALNYHPDSAEINAHAGFICLRENELTLSKLYFETAIKNEFSSPSVYYNLAYVLFLLHDFDGALQQLLPVQESTELLKQVTLLGARCKHNTEDLDSAITSLKQFLLQYPDDSDAEGLLAIILCDNAQINEAIDHANKVLAVAESNFDALMARGSALIIKNEVEEAQHDFKLAVEVSPQSGRAWSGLGQVTFYNFHFKDALHALKNAVLFMPEHIGTWHILAWTYISLEDYPQALATFEKSYQLDRTFGETHGGLAVAHALLGDSQKADRHIKLAEKIAPDSFSVIYAKMVRLTQQGKTKEANALLEHTKDTQYDIFETLPRTLIDNRMNALKNTNTLRKV